MIFASLPSLKELNLSCSKIDSAGPVVINNLDSLVKFAMSSCNLSKSPLRLASLPSLTELNLSDSKMDFASPVVIENLDSLEKLDMRNFNFFKSPLSFDSLTNLKELDISSNKLDSDALVGMEKLVLLEKLNLCSCDLNNLPFRLSSLTKLRKLNLQGNPLDPDTLDKIFKLESLEYLDLSFCQLTKLPSNFERLKNLENLCLRENDFEEYPSVLRSLPKHTYIDISDSDFSEQCITRAADDQVFFDPVDSITNREVVDQVWWFDIFPSEDYLKERSLEYHSPKRVSYETGSEDPSGKSVTISSELHIGKGELANKPTSSKGSWIICKKYMD
ncbi:leucine-rich repeat protein lrrA-like [Watersipora subatra]|uniref:leucine-rich repeat protein lrrA-like n=1 Tax=Watersipora subatra TaxID=2589382 RepID=UPI00355BE34F